MKKAEQMSGNNPDLPGFNATFLLLQHKFKVLV